MTNLLKETIECLNKNCKDTKDVEWIGIADNWIDWETFSKIADINYDNGFGGAEINTSLIIYGKGFWLEREEYDGAECWNFRQEIKKPKQKVNSFKILHSWEDDYV